METKEILPIDKIILEKEIIPVKRITQNHITVSVPGSKSITNRALLLATLAEGESRLKGTLFSDDSRHFLKCVQDLGFAAVADEDTKEVHVHGLGGAVPRKEARIYVGSAGTAARFLAAYLGCSEGSFYLDASEQMRKRPMEPLLRALESVGAEITCTEKAGHFPMRITGRGIKAHHVTVDIDKSSQFLSALLIAGCLAKEDLHIHLQGSHGMAYIQMTIRMMKQFGVEAVLLSEKEFVIPAGQRYRAMDYQIEPDASAACYFWAMAAVLGISVTVAHTHFDSLQGDVEFARILERMGCVVEDRSEGITVTGPRDVRSTEHGAETAIGTGNRLGSTDGTPQAETIQGRLKGIEVDMHTCSDQAITLAAIAPFAAGPVRITGISHIRLQESDRIAAIVENLTALGVHVEEEPDGVLIYPYGYSGDNMEHSKVLIQTHDDHRLAMGFAITGLRRPGVVISDPLCCRKTFENYFEVLGEAVDYLQSVK